MAYRKRYRRKRSSSGNLLGETISVANRLSWKLSILLGVILFVLFYWVAPTAITHQLESLQGNPYRPLIESLFARRLHWFQWIGIALGLVCAFFAMRNYLSAPPLDRGGQRNVGFFSRFLARWLD